MATEMKFADKSGDESAPSPEIPKEQRNLRTQPYDKSVSDLVSMMHDKDIILDPDYQRNYIWDNKKSSLLIESILLNVPIPVIYVSQDEEDRWVVIDGLQRLNTLRRFYDNEFKLTGLEVLPELNKLQFSTLNPKAKRMFNNGIIRIISILAESHPEIKYDIFERLNGGAILLNSQELRNCLYRGSFNNLLKKLRKYNLFLKCIGLKKPHKRFYDAELILRYLALSDAYDVKKGKVMGYSSKMKTFLNNYMKVNQNVSKKELDALEDKFVRTIEKVSIVFGEPAFRRIYPGGKKDNRLNRALMDAVMIGFEHISLLDIKRSRKKIMKLYRELPDRDTVFNDAIIAGTSDTKKIEYRLTTWLNELRKTI